jgi:hypothetical protein
MNSNESVLKARKDLRTLVLSLLLWGVVMTGSSIWLYVRLDHPYHDAPVTADMYASMLRMLKIMLGWVTPLNGVMQIFIAVMLVINLRRLPRSNK